MSRQWSTVLPVVLLVLGAWTAPGASIPVTTPMMDRFVAINSDENVTYSCSVTDPMSVVVWEVERSQIRNPTQFQQLQALGIVIEPMNTASTMSTITITRNARESNDDDDVIMVQCLANQGISSIEGERYSVVSFSAPSAVRDLDLLPSLTLEWNRPSQPPFTEVSINYTIQINATEDSGMNFVNFTSDSSLSVEFLETMLQELGSECVEFEFFVFATNDAGTGPLARIQDTVPISPDVTTISEDFRVERVDLQSLRVDLSFPAVQPCSENFPLDNYTIFLDGGVALLLSPNQVVTGVPLTGLTLAGLTRDNSFSLTVQACNDVTCRTSNASILNTTDTQAVQAVFFQNRLYLECSFADNSQARGCIFTLVLVTNNETERFEVQRRGSRGSMCTTANNRREVYSSVLVMDWEENGEDGAVALNITGAVLNVSSLAEYTSLTGCVEVPNPTAAIVGGIFGALSGALIIAVVVVLLVLFFVYRKKSTKVVEKVKFSTLERKKKFAAFAPAEEQPLMFECDVTADEECATKIKDDLIAAQRQTSITSDSAAETSATSALSAKGEFSVISMADLEKDKHAWIEGHDDPDPKQPLTIKVKWRPLIQSLIAVNSLRPEGAKPLLAEGKDLSKVKVRLDMS